jgi:hypothetical protein
MASVDAFPYIADRWSANEHRKTTRCHDRSFLLPASLNSQSTYKLLPSAPWPAREAGARSSQNRSTLGSQMLFMSSRWKSSTSPVSWEYTLEGVLIIQDGRNNAKKSTTSHAPWYNAKKATTPHLQLGTLPSEKQTTRLSQHLNHEWWGEGTHGFRPLHEPIKTPLKLDLLSKEAQSNVQYLPSRVHHVVHYSMETQASCNDKSRQHSTSLSRLQMLHRTPLDANMTSSRR